MEEYLKFQGRGDLWLMYEEEKKNLPTMSHEEYEKAVKAIADKYGI